MTHSWNKFILAALLGSLSLLVACGGASLPAASSAGSSKPATETETSNSAAATSVSEATATTDLQDSGSTTALETTDSEPTVRPSAMPTRKSAEDYADLQIVTLLPRDAIPAIDNPKFLSADEADEFYDPEELIIGVMFNGDSRAYSVPFLSNHEIVNDTVGSVKIAVTW